MADLDTLLGSSWEDAELPEPPAGTWKAELKRIFLDEKDRTDKNGNPFRMCRMLFDPQEAQDDVDSDEATEFVQKSEGEALVPMALFVRGKRDLTRVGRVLSALGVPMEGRTVRDTIADYQGGHEGLIEIEEDPQFGKQVRTVRGVD